jgi:hypothetical protein
MGVGLAFGVIVGSIGAGFLVGMSGMSILLVKQIFE